jgi:hypothetical protein
LGRTSEILVKHFDMLKHRLKVLFWNLVHEISGNVAMNLSEELLLGGKGKLLALKLER